MNIKICKHCNIGITSDLVAKYSTTMCKPCHTVYMKQLKQKSRANPGVREKEIATKAKVRSDPLVREANRQEIAQRRSTEEGRAKSRLAGLKCMTAKRQTDKKFYAQEVLRSLIGGSLRRQGYTKNSRTHEILGADFETVMKHLGCESSIPSGMAIDHILPMALAFDEASAIRLNHYTNLQLLTKEANLEKSDWLVNENGEYVQARTLTVIQRQNIIANMGVL